MSATGRVVVQSFAGMSPKKTMSSFSVNFSQLASSQTPRFAKRDTSDGSEGVFLRCAPTTEKWSMTRMLLLPDQHVHVSLRVKLAEGAEWLRVSKLGGMDGWVPADCIAMDEPQKERGGELATQRGGTLC